MHCPLCGAVLVEAKRPKIPDASYLNYDSWPEELQKAADILEQDHSDWYKCDHCNSFRDDSPLRVHHPFRGILSAPGDSWSLNPISNWKMHCPFCAGLLVKVERNSNDSDHSEWYKCVNCKSFGDDYPLTCHHPNDIRSAPGDSWSLSWIK